MTKQFCCWCAVVCLRCTKRPLMRVHINGHLFDLTCADAAIRVATRERVINRKTKAKGHHIMPPRTADIVWRKFVIFNNVVCRLSVIISHLVLNRLQRYNIYIYYARTVCIFSHFIVKFPQKSAERLGWKLWRSPLPHPSKEGVIDDASRVVPPKHSITSRQWRLNHILISY